MKKIIVLALVLSMLALLIVPSFADSTEEEKIIEAAQKGVVLASLLYGQQVFFDIYAIVDIENEDAEIYEFMDGLVEYDSNDVSIKEYVPYEGEMADPLSSMDNVYAKSGNLIDSLDDLNSLVEKYLLNITVKTDDENTVNLIDGKKSHHPTLRKIDNEIYIHFGFGNFSQATGSQEIFFEQFEVVSVDGNKALVKAPEKCGCCIELVDHTVELEKVNGQWKVCGGTIFTDEEHGSFHDSDLFAPRTGEDFSLITHTLVIGVCAALMLVLSKRRKLEI